MIVKRLLGSWNSSGERVATWLARVGAILLFILMVLTFFDVIGRGFNHPIVGTVEVTELMIGLIVYLGIGLTTIQHGHIRVDIVIMYLSPRVRVAIEVLTLGISISFAVLMCWQLWLKSADTVEMNDVTQIWAVPIWPVAYIIAAGSITLVAGLMLQFFHALHAVIMGDGES